MAPHLLEGTRRDVAEVARHVHDLVVAVDEVHGAAVLGCLLGQPPEHAQDAQLVIAAVQNVAHLSEKKGPKPIRFNPRPPAHFLSGGMKL